MTAYENWVRMFGGHWLEQIDIKRHDAFFQKVEQLARPHLRNGEEWFADYRRIRVSARKIS